MRVAWVTPLSRGSGISKYSLAVLPALAARADVNVWAPVAADDYPVGDLSVFELRDDAATADALRGYDLVVYNTGNNPAYHVEIHRASAAVPGVVVVHDKRMHGFFFTLWAVIDREPARYAAMMRYYYGDPGEMAAVEVLSSRAGVDSFDGFPLVEPAIWNATATVVHSLEAKELACRYGRLVPVLVAGLPFDASAIPDLEARPTRARLGLAADAFLIVSTGGVYEQKRLVSLLRAVASDPELRDGSAVVIVGGGRDTYIAELARLADELGIADRVRLTGYVADAEMYGWIEAADVAVNLRYPSMESASLSLVEQMYFGKPVVVSDTSYYAELPDDVALKVPVSDDEVPVLAGHLVALMNDDGLRERMGKAAAELARTRHDPESYAVAVLGLPTADATRSAGEPG